MLYMLSECLCISRQVDCISCMLSCGIQARISAVALVKGMSSCMSVMRPPPPLVGLSCRSVVYPGKLSVFLLCVSLVSWIAAMRVLCACRKCLSCVHLFWMPFMFRCSILRVWCGHGLVSEGVGGGGRSGGKDMSGVG